MSQLELVAISGPLEGTHFPLTSGEPLLLGRSSRGVHLPDPNVSVQHAQIEIMRGKLIITDLGSATGTYIDTLLIPPSTATPLEPGAIVRVGETRFKVVQIHNYGWLRVLFLLFSSLVAVLSCAGIVFSSVFMKESGTRIVWRDPINIAPGQAEQKIEIPPPFLRRFGMVASDVAVRSVRDANKDGIDEIWLKSEAHEYLVTFAPEGGWTVLAVLPKGCTDRATIFDRPSEIVGWPDLRCGGEIWSFDGDSYRPMSHDGVVVWNDPRFKRTATPTPGGDPAAPPAVAPTGAPPPYAGVLEPARLNLFHPERLRAFLDARGVMGTPLYLICEGAIPGVAAQARLETGELVRLTHGCLSDLTLDGEKLGQPRMIAFTAGGRMTLLDDLRTTWGGSPEGLWIEPGLSALVESYSADPGLPRGASRLLAISEGETSDWIGPLEAKPQPPTRLLPDKGEPIPAALATTLVTDGELTLDPPGCAELKVTLSDFRCRWSKGCVSGSTFLQVEDVGCGTGQILQVPYTSGVYDAQTSYPLRVRVESRERNDGSEIVFAQIGFVPIPAP